MQNNVNMLRTLTLPTLQHKCYANLQQNFKQPENLQFLASVKLSSDELAKKQLCTQLTSTTRKPGDHLFRHVTKWMFSRKSCSCTASILLLTLACLSQIPTEHNLLLHSSTLFTTKQNKGTQNKASCNHCNMERNIKTCS